MNLPDHSAVSAVPRCRSWRSIQSSWLTACLLAGLAVAGVRAETLLVARFLNAPPWPPKRVVISGADGDRLLDATVGNRHRSCRVSLHLPAGDSLPCEDMAGTGTLSCGDGRQLNLNWAMTSCHSGFGRSMETGDPTFVFGFGNYLDAALDEIDSARKKGSSEKQRPTTLSVEAAGNDDPGSK